MAPETYDANVKIRDLPRAVDEKLNKIAIQRGKYKHEIIRDAIVEFVEMHEAEIPESQR